MCCDLVANSSRETVDVLVSYDKISANLLQNRRICREYVADPLQICRGGISTTTIHEFVTTARSGILGVAFRTMQCVLISNK